jgi:uncharacterized protein involved in exopolysaccharide biosynthesis/Mrp family chromosome partitioning ATPase
MNNDIDLRSLLGIFRRQILLILSLVVGLTSIAGIIVYSIEPRYSASALVFVDTASKDILEADARSQNGSTDNARVESEVAILQSDGVLLDVINSQNLVADDEFGVKVGLTDRFLEMIRLKTVEPPDASEAVASVLNSFRGAVSANRRGLTYLINVTVTSRSREKAAKLANAVTETYIRRQVDSKVSATLASRDILQKRVDAARSTIADSARGVDDFILGNINTLREQGSSNVGVLYDELTRIQQERREGLTRAETIDQTLQRNDLATLVQTLETQAAEELERQREALAGQLASATPASAIDLRAELQKLDESIAEEGRRALTSLRSEVQNFEQQESSVRTNLTEAVLTSNLPNETLTDLYSLRQTAEGARREFDNLSARLQRLDTQAALQMADSRVVSEALPPQDASFPRKRLILPLAAVMALGFGVGLAFVREYLVGGFTSEDQVSTVLRLPLASVAPRAAGEPSQSDNSGHSLSDTIIRSPMSMFTESVRRIRVAIDQYLYKRNAPPTENGGGTVVMISSALPNEGKSTIALSLARTYALSGKRTLIVDCDLRKPSIHRHLGLPSDTTFVTYLQGGDAGSLPKLTTADPSTGLTVVLGGRQGNTPTDQLLMGQEMAKLIAVARRNFDYIILDTPPVEPVVDGLYLARHADVIAFVVKWAATPQSSAKRAVAALRDNSPEGVPILAVLNQQERGKMFGYSSYSAYYVE